MISKTALLCALARAAYTHGYNKNNREKIFEDEFAQDFVSLKDYRNAYKFAKELFPATKFPTKNLLDEYFLPIVLPRNRFAEDIVYEKQRTGDVQYVLLGAGLDSFALRNKSKNVDVFELDLYETQVFKIERMRKLFEKRRPKVHFVEIDFNKDSISERLTNSGFNPKVRSVFSILGVSYYIPIEIFFKTVSLIFKIAAPGSGLVFDYYEKEDPFAPTLTKSARLKQIAADCGEIMADGYDPGEVAERVKKAGFKSCQDLSPQDIDNAYFKDSTGLSAFEGVHLVYARK